MDAVAVEVGSALEGDGATAEGVEVDEGACRGLQSSLGALFVDDLSPGCDSCVVRIWKPLVGVH